MRVSRSEYYNWLSNTISKRGKENSKLTQMIKETFIQNRNIY